MIMISVITKKMMITETITIITETRTMKKKSTKNMTAMRIIEIMIRTMIM